MAQGNPETKEGLNDKTYQFSSVQFSQLPRTIDPQEQQQQQQIAMTNPITQLLRTIDPQEQQQQQQQQQQQNTMTNPISQFSCFEPSTPGVERV